MEEEIENIFSGLPKTDDDFKKSSLTEDIRLNINLNQDICFLDKNHFKGTKKDPLQLNLIIGIRGPLLSLVTLNQMV